METPATWCNTNVTVTLLPNGYQRYVSITNTAHGENIDVVIGEQHPCYRYIRAALVPSGRGETRKKAIVNGGAVDAGDDEDTNIL